MDVWHTSRLYKLWVVGGLIAVAAFAVIGGLSDPSDQDFIFYLIPVVAVWVFGIFFLQWRALRRDVEANPILAEPSAGLARWSIIFGVLLCVAIFAGVFLFYADVGGTLYPFGETGPGFPVALLPAFVLIAYGALRSLNVLRQLGRSADERGAGEIKGPTDIQAPGSPGRPRSSD
ncbi:MAG: hypothetical protein FJW90_02625 [Actinobacteria bacterium]|nr:hypothetical protein [Actinomycetota bacterium]